MSVRTLRAAVAALALSAPLAVGVGGVGSGAVTTPHLVVTPSTGLHNGEWVKVSGSGFRAHDMVFLVECLSTAKGAAGCNTAGATPVTITAKGVLVSTRFKVMTGKVGSGHCGTTARNLKGCEMSAGNAAGKDTASTVITFKLP
ncbi:MAG TPA: neocarzinostatin apoprotein domain-containing protein [Acidimicrobiales bacterium]|nr:neocarzinostatin apoprotein domain-containing protein [Acidimicrobiales bacterium]